MEVGIGTGHIALGGTQLFSPKRGQSPPIFGSFLLWPNGWMHQGATWYGARPQLWRLCVRWVPSTLPERGRSPVAFSPGDFVLVGDQPLPKKGWNSQFSAHFYCGQTAGCIKVPLGTEVGLCPDDIVLNWDPAPLRKGGGAPSPIFGRCLL